MNDNAVQTERDTFAQRLKAWRKEKGLTQAQLGELLGSSRSAIERYESANTPPPREIADKLAVMMGLNPKSIPCRKRAEPCRCDEPLNDEECRFAELNYDYMLHFMR